MFPTVGLSYLEAVPPVDMPEIVQVTSRSQRKAKFFDFLDENRLIFVVLSGRFQRLERDFGFLY